MKKLSHYFLPGIAVIGVIIALFSCSKTQTVAVDYSKVFPQTIGDSWVYSIKDTLDNFNDSVSVKIIGTAIITGNQTAYLWKYHYYKKGLNDTAYVVLHGDTAIIYVDTLKGSGTAYVEYQRFLLPVGVGQTLISNGDTSVVTRQHTVYVPAGNFGPSYEILHNTSNLGHHANDDLFYFESVGVLKLTHASQDSTDFLERGVWLLQSFTNNH